ncbi:MAG: hypothetical protein H6978_13110 [Gammaproteobacteria bacterium]|nr:hypothetical protein [Gammaproteobacteria bacterium]
MNGLQSAYDQMVGYRDGNATLKTVGEVSEHGYWVHDLMRRSFTIEDVQGQLELLDVRCERRTGRFNDIPVGKTFNVPVSWGDCSVYIKGSPETTLSFYELSDE